MYVLCSKENRKQYLPPPLHSAVLCFLGSGFCIVVCCRGSGLFGDVNVLKDHKQAPLTELLIWRKAAYLTALTTCYCSLRAGHFSSLLIVEGVTTPFATICQNFLVNLLVPAKYFVKDSEPWIWIIEEDLKLESLLIHSSFSKYLFKIERGTLLCTSEFACCKMVPTSASFTSLVPVELLPSLWFTWRLRDGVVINIPIT